MVSEVEPSLQCACQAILYKHSESIFSIIAYFIVRYPIFFLTWTGIYAKLRTLRKVRKSMKTPFIKKTDIKRQWHLVDVKDRILGRAATEIASLLTGKLKTSYTPHVDNGDAVVVVNASKIRVSGKKMKKKRYKRYSGYPSGLSEEPLEHLLKRKPGDVIIHAVKGMLPKSKLGSQMLKRLKVYSDDKHPHAAQLAGAEKKKEK